jgi:hypothetical protein
MGTLLVVWSAASEMALERRTAIYWKLSRQCRGDESPPKDIAMLGVKFLLAGLSDQQRLYDAVRRLEGTISVDGGQQRD